VSTIKYRFVQVIRVLGIMAVVAALSAAAFPAHSFAAEIRPTSAPDYGKVVILVTDGSVPTLNSNRKPLAGAAVEIINSSGAVVAKAITDATGQVSLANSEAIYKARVSADGFNTQTVAFKIRKGETTRVSVALTAATAPAPAPGK
jgi:Carboxypeptidase regulatory-like domain